jgi:N-acyl-D-aspartate/D-glutamate deacylase
VREHQTVPWEEAVHQMTEVPARFYGVTDRGLLAEGYHADVVVFDPARVAPEAERTVDDLPGGASRIYAGATGIEHVLVNGVPVVSAGTLTGATPGTLLRSGRDTTTVSVPGG